MNKAILVAHSGSVPGNSSIPKVKTITPGFEYLSFDKAKEYMESSKTSPEYGSTSFGQFSPLADRDCDALFGRRPAGTGIVFTNLRKGGDVAGVPIYALRGIIITSKEINDFINNNNISSMVLLACRK